jgi:hypothetical protein
MVSVARSQLNMALINFNPMALVDTLTDPIYDFTVSVKDNYKAALRWRTDGDKVEESFFTIEKSYNNIDFIIAGVLKKIQGVSWVEFLDESPARSHVYYRIKQTSANHSATYSTTVAVSLSGEAFCKFYPNPVDKVLIVRSEFPVDIQITDKFGKQLLLSHQEAGLKLVDVSSLEPGLYIITFFQKEANRLITEKLVKK